MRTRRGVLLEDTVQTWLAESDTEDEEARTLRLLQAEAVTYRIALGPRAGRKVLTLRGAIPRKAAARQPLCADIAGFSRHAAVRIEAHDRRRLERLFRYIARPTLSDERSQTISLNDCPRLHPSQRPAFCSADRPGRPNRALCTSNLINSVGVASTG
jgi:hypothetical protein